MTAQTIAFVNRKGGVGKTSMVFHLGGCYVEAGYRVLLVDNDPQHSLTSGIFGPRFTVNRPANRTIAGAFLGKDADPVQAVIDTPFANLSLLPGSDSLERFNRTVPGNGRQAAEKLKRFLAPLSDDFDFVLIDNPPNLQLCTWAALAAASLALCVSQPEDYGSQGGVAVGRLIDDVQQSTNPRLKFLGFLLNMVNRRLAVHQAYEANLRHVYGDAVLATTIPQFTHFKEAVAARTPISRYKPKSMAAAAIEALSMELLDRMETTDVLHTNSVKTSEARV